MVQLMLKNLIAFACLFLITPAYAQRLATTITCKQKNYVYKFTTNVNGSVVGEVTGGKHDYKIEANYELVEGVIKIQSLGTLAGVTKGKGDFVPFLMGINLFRLEYDNDRRKPKDWTLVFEGFPSQSPGKTSASCSE